jgi:hypothetical protein
VVCESFQFIGAPKGNAEFSEKPPARPAAGNRPAPAARPAEDDAPPPSDDNIPF